ncbi:DUF7448 domain-containing protein [Sporosarcina sp. ITBMC105]
MNSYWRKGERAYFNDLEGKILSQINVDKDADEIRFITADGETYVMYHEQDCCESVWVEDINGELDDLIGDPILLAEEVSQEGDDTDWGTSTWTFYKISTIKGTAVLRWIGESNGYYSESVDFRKLNEGEVVQ